MTGSRTSNSILIVTAGRNSFDVIKVSLGSNEREYEVLEVLEHALKEDAAKMYKSL